MYIFTEKNQTMKSFMLARVKAKEPMKLIVEIDIGLLLIKNMVV